MTKETRNIVLHLLGSITFLCIPIFSSPDFGQGLNIFHIAPFQKSFVRFGLFLALFYATYYFFIPKLYFNQKKWVFVLAIIAAYALIAGITESIFGSMHGLPRPHPEFGFPPPRNRPFLMDTQMFIPFLLIISLAFLIKLNNRLIEIHDEKLNAEVSYLKAQINPHFLFNTLNSLYALTLQKSNEAPNAVLKLSGIMRYIVTESAQDYVSLDKELNYIKDYIELQKLRMADDAALTFEIEGQSTGRIIAPLILIPFIENAFKYGINPDADSFIHIKIVIENRQLIMVVKNAIVTSNLSEDLKTEEGLKNTQKRLDLMYAGNYVLEVIENEKTYEVHLKIELL